MHAHSVSESEIEFPLTEERVKALRMTGTDLISLQQLTATQSYMLAVSFPQSRSYSYRAALAIASQADRYFETDITGALMHFAAFSPTREAAMRALSIIKYVRAVKGLQLAAGGRLIQHRFRIESTLQCYLNSFAATDWRAHCFMVAPLAGAKYILPCRLAYQDGVRIAREHPSSPLDQLQAVAVHRGCDWCPRFDIRNVVTLTTEGEALCAPIPSLPSSCLPDA
jgi:hypothetical protein